MPNGLPVASGSTSWILLVKCSSGSKSHRSVLGEDAQQPVAALADVALAQPGRQVGQGDRRRRRHIAQAGAGSPPGRRPDAGRSAAGVSAALLGGRAPASSRPRSTERCGSRSASKARAGPPAAADPRSGRPGRRAGRPLSGRRMGDGARRAAAASPAAADVGHQGQLVVLVGRHQRRHLDDPADLRQLLVRARSRPGLPRACAV